MKFNWGHGLATVIVLGIVGFSSLVWITTKERIDMVTDDYYPKELEFQDQINKERRYNELTQKITVEYGDALRIQFPKVTDEPAVISGTLHIYRPSDKRLDIEQKIQLDEYYQMMIDKSRLHAGKYEIIIDWSANEVDYLAKQRLIVK